MHLEFLLGVLIGMLHTDGATDAEILESVESSLHGAHLMERQDFGTKLDAVFKEFLPGKLAVPLDRPTT